MRPFVRSASPVVDIDQRVGMFDSNVAAAATEPQNADEPGDTMPQVTTSIPAANRHRTVSPLEPAPSVLPQPVAAHVFRQMDIEKPIGQIPGDTVEDSRDPSIHPQVRPADLRTSPLLSPTAVRESTREFIRLIENHEDNITIHEKEDLSSTPRVEPTRSEPQQDFVRRLEFAPRPSFAPTAAEPDRDGGIREVEEREEPRVTIGSIHVEVIPAAAEKPSTTPIRQGPLTAASVSVIGPLSGGVRSNRRLSLRYR
jgi:hypothetical protein